MLFKKGDTLPNDKQDPILLPVPPPGLRVCNTICIE